MKGAFEYEHFTNNRNQIIILEDKSDVTTAENCQFIIILFRRFYREEELHEQQGVGKGLYLAREIVTRQGGYIKVVSETGHGSEFSIMLPVR